MNVAFRTYSELPDSPYRMWVRGELAEWLGLPDGDGTRVEVIQGDIAVSPGPAFSHNRIITGIMTALINAKTADPAFAWESEQVTNLDLYLNDEGFIPDLLIIDIERAAEMDADDLKLLQPGDVAMVVEVTSPSNANSDREPGPQHRTKNGNIIKSKWTGYARGGIPYYLLVDRDPRVARAILYTDPDPASGRYTSASAWTFGDTICLPEPFAFEIDTSGWKTWQV